ncbi:MAG TPA: NUDIX hydrolase [Acidimicrobiales bacterium]|nr:NUDIX hydrolase [Acidimicrobiales bacterium]
MGRFATVARFVARTVLSGERRWADRKGTVRAAGGILLRQGRPRGLEVAVVHRPGRDDWSLPKGKLDEGETFEDCALREVLEETGYRCRLAEFVGTTEYRDRRDRRKVVWYWLMDVLDGEFAPSREVDELQWLDLEMAARVLTYPHDRDLLRSLDAPRLARSG